MLGADGLGAGLSPVGAESFSALIAEAAAGSEEAINAIVAKYAPYILLVVRSIMPPGDPVRDAMDSVDMQQEVFLRLVRAIGRGQAPVDSQVFREFVREIAANTTRSEIRRQTAQRRSVHRHDARDPATLNVAVNEPGPADIAEFREDWQRLLAGVLPAYRVVLESRRAGWSAPEIAEKYNLRLRTVEHILKKHRGRWKQIRGGGVSGEP